MDIAGTIIKLQSLNFNEEGKASTSCIFAVNAMRNEKTTYFCEFEGYVAEMIHERYEKGIKVNLTGKLVEERYKAEYISKRSSSAHYKFKVWEVRILSSQADRLTARFMQEHEHLPWSDRMNLLREKLGFEPEDYTEIENKIKLNKEL